LQHSDTHTRTEHPHTTYSIIHITFDSIQDTLSTVCITLYTYTHTYTHTRTHSHTASTHSLLHSFIHTPTMSIKIVALLGSLRTDSYTKKLLLQAQSILQSQSNNSKDNIIVEIFDNVGLLPFVNEDLESDYYANNQHVIRFKEMIRQADGILLATPEYNYSVPGALKNAVDIASRPHGDNVLVGKPFGIISSSLGITGGIRAQMALRNSMFAFGGYTTGYPEFILNVAHQAFDADTKQLKDPQTAQALENYLNTFITLVKKNITPVSNENTATDLDAAAKKTKKDQTN